MGRRTKTPARRSAARVLAPIACIALSACANRPIPHATEAPDDDAAIRALAPAPASIPAIPGRMLVLSMLDGAPPARAPVVTPSDASDPLIATLYERTPPEHAAPPGWLIARPAPALRPARFAKPGADDAIRSWLLACVTPTDSRPPSIRVDGARVSLHWFDPPPPRLAPPPGAPAENSAALASLRSLLAPLRADPESRWRARLLADRLAPAGLDLGPDPDLGHPVLEALASQREDHWRIALDLLRAADAPLADRIFSALTRVVVLGASVAFPAWTETGAGAPAGSASPADADSLLVSLLSAPTPGARADTARAWLTAQPSALAWIDSDVVAAPTDDGLVRVRIGVANLGAEPTTGAVSAPRPGSTDLCSLAPGQGAFLDVAAPAGATIEARVGDRVFNLATAPPSRATPPGVALGPCLNARTALSFLSGAEIVPAPERAATGLLQVRPTPPEQPADSRWEVVLTCRDPGEGGSVRIHLGPERAPLHVLRIDPKGFLVDEAAAGGARARAIPVRRDAGRWVARVPIPKSAIIEGRWLLLGLDRADSAGERSTWPRAVFPWQPAPGRIAVDLSAWGGLEAAPASAPSRP